MSSTVDAVLHEALGQRGRELRRGQAHVPADHHRARPDHRRVGAADAPGDVRVEVVGQAPADVVGLEAPRAMRKPPATRADHGGWISR
jgi:hypothetical protein